ncbi:MAG TPA: DUF2905 family protein [Rhizomicrobium sp.]|nr:DUF2905 family protein [Rhizomicrobium sp.]
MQALGWLIIVLLGALVLMPAMSYFDALALPGDMHLVIGDWRFFAPFTSSLIASVVLTLLFWLLRR